LINQAHQIEIERALPWNGMKILPPENRQPSPHILAQATMQLSGKR
jgi:hypothetical protein